MGGTIDGCGATDSDEIAGEGVRGTDVGVAGVAGVTTAVGDAVGRVMVGVADADCAGRGAGSERTDTAVGATARVAVGIPTVTNPRITASIVRSGVGWGRGGSDWALALLQPARRISARTRKNLDKPGK